MGGAPAEKVRSRFAREGQSAAVCFLFSFLSQDTPQALTQTIGVRTPGSGFAVTRAGNKRKRREFDQLFVVVRRKGCGRASYVIHRWDA